MADDNPFAQFGTPQQIPESTSAPAPASSSDSGNIFSSFKPQPIDESAQQQPSGLASTAESVVKSLPFGRAALAPLDIYRAATALPDQLQGTWGGLQQDEAQKQSADPYTREGWVPGQAPHAGWTPDVAPVKAAASAAANVIGVPFAPVTSAFNDLAGGISGGMAYGAQAAGEPIAKAINPQAQLPTHQQVAQSFEPGVQTALGLGIPGEGGLAGIRSAYPREMVPEPSAPSAEPIRSQAQQTGNPDDWKFEQKARRGDLGPEIQERAQAFDIQQQNQLAQQRQNISQTLNPTPEPGFPNSESESQLPPATRFDVNNPKDVVRILRQPLQIDAADQAAQQQADLASRNAAINAPREQAANHLDAAEQVAQTLRNEFSAGRQNIAQQNAAVTNQGEAIRAGLSPTGDVVARDSQTAAQVAQQAIQNSEAAADARVNDLYQARADIPGEYDRDMLEDGPKEIRKDLSSGPINNQVRISQQNTPRAKAALDLIDQTFGAEPAEVLPNEATPFQVGRNEDTGQFERQQPAQPINGQTMEDLRKAINQQYGYAWREAQKQGGTMEDVRATKRVLDAFGDFVGGVEDEGGFSGDVDALRQATADARAAHSNYKSTYEPQGSGDQAGKFIQNAVGRYDQPMPANQFLNGIYNNPNVARRVIQILGDQSPEAAAIKQGLFSDSIETPEGPLAPQKAAANLTQQVRGTGRQIAETYLSPAERQQWLNHADDLRNSVAEPPAEADVVSKKLKEIAGPNGQPMDTNTFSRQIWGNDPKNVGANPIGVKIAQHLKDTYGEGSEPFNNFRSATKSKLLNADSGIVGFEPKNIAQTIRNFFNGSGRAMADVLYSPEEKAEWLSYADDLDKHDAYLQSLNPGKLSDVDKAFNRIIDSNATPEEILSDLLGSDGIGQKGLSSRLYQRLAAHFGENSPYINALKDAHFKVLTQKLGTEELYGPEMTANRIDKMLDSELGKTMYSDQERSMLKAYGDLSREFIPPQASANWSGTASPVQKTIADLGRRMLASVGAVIGGTFGHGIMKLPAEAAGAYAGNKIGSILDKMQQVANMRRVEKQMPLLADQWKNYRIAAEAARRANSPQFNKLAEAAAANLVGTLTKIGVDPSQVQMPNDQQQSQ